MMTITKFGQCCLLLEYNGKQILTDPGEFGAGFVGLKNLDLILITHEHGDHLHTRSLETIVTNNPQAIVICNSSVGNILEKAGIACTILEGNEDGEYADIHLEAYDGKHEEIFEEFGLVQNTGYFIDNTLFYPGDAYTEPHKKVAILALPVAGPWCKLSDALHYALRVKPNKVFPVHDWLLNKDGISLTYKIAENILHEQGITFIPLHNNQTEGM